MNINIHIDSMNFDCKYLTGREIPKNEQTTGKRLPFFYFWMKDHYFQTSQENFSKTNWSFNDDSRAIRHNSLIKEKLLKQLPDIVGLSLYNWNSEILLDNAKWFKEQNPNVLIIAGGPVAEATKDFFEKNQEVDIVILGPGIQVFKNVIDCVIEGRSTEQVQGVTYMKDNQLIINPSLPKQHQPLLINWAENFREEVTALIKEYHRSYKRVIVQTYYLHGCPYSCSFCEQGLQSWTKINKRPIQYLYKEIDLLCELADVDNDDSQIEIEFLDANFGITKDYLDIMQYLIDTNLANGNKLILGIQYFAKNSVDTVFEIYRMIRNSTLPTQYFKQGYMALQDTNAEVLRLNGRPPSKEWEKIAEFKKLTQTDRIKLNQVDLILGLIGQTYESLSVTLCDLFEHHLFGTNPPQLFIILPNTPLTINGVDNLKVTNMWHRRFVGKGYHIIDFDDDEISSIDNLSKPILAESDTMTSQEIMTIFYMYTLLAHLRSHTRWLDTPLAFMLNHHGKTDKDFVKTFAKHFHPTKQHLLPASVREDINCLTRWLTGDDKFFMRRDNDDKGYLVFHNVAKYRFHHSYKDVSNLLYKIFTDTVGKDTTLLKGVMQWLELTTWFSDKKKTSMVSYNYDDVALLKQENFYLSKFTANFNKSFSSDSILEMYKNLKSPDLEMNLLWEPVPESQQKVLNFSK